MLTHIKRPCVSLKVIPFMVAFFVALPAAFSVFADDTSGQRMLTPGETLYGTLNKGDSHVYGLTLPASQFVRGEALQIEVDVAVTIVDPAGNDIASFDGPSRGIENFHFETTSNGKYLIKISPYKQSQGKYSIGITYSAPKATTAEATIDQMMAIYKDNTPGGVVTVVRDGKTIFAKGYGLANLEYGIPNTTKTPYHMASVSKQFTAFAVVMLSEEGKLDLDDDVRQYLPTLHDFGHVITLRHLLNHTSGLRDHWNLWALSGGLMDDVIRQQDLLRLIYHQRELNFTPGERYMYSNSGYLLLSEVVKAVTEEPFAKWMHDNVFEPLNMHSTQIYDDHQRIVKNRSYSYHGSDSGFEKSVLSYANSGATSLFSTAEDLTRWLQNFHTGSVGGKTTIEKMQVQGVLNNGETIDYALGISIGERQGLREVSHGGADAGYRTMLSYYPDINAGVIVLGNSAGFSPGFIANTAAKWFFKSEMKQGETAIPSSDTTETTTDEPATDLAAPQNTDSAAVSPELANRLTGKYAAEGGLLITISFDDGKLFGQANNNPQLPLIPLEQHLYKADIADRDIKIEFDLTSEGQVEQARLHQGNITALNRIKSWTPNAQTLHPYTGRYYSEELETFYQIELQDEKLVLKHLRHGEMSLSPIEEHRFATGIWFLGDLNFDLNDKGTITQMRASSGRVRNLTFTKVN